MVPNNFYSAIFLHNTCGFTDKTGVVSKLSCRRQFGQKANSCFLIPPSSVYENPSNHQSAHYVVVKPLFISNNGRWPSKNRFSQNPKEFARTSVSALRALDASQLKIYKRSRRGAL